VDRILSFRVVKAVLRVVHFCLNLKTSISMHNLLVSITAVTFSVLHGCKEQELELENTTNRQGVRLAVVTDSVDSSQTALCINCRLESPGVET